MHHFISIDLGATSGRVILATLDGKRIAMDTLHRFPTRLVAIGGKYYWNIYALYEEILQGLRLAGRSGVRIESIGIDTWGVDMAFI
ncbi:MAG: rhamnulokinase, partial [Alistipes sp.]|nr:rhamnulokinase [Alistipes sp.]